MFCECSPCCYLENLVFHLGNFESVLHSLSAPLRQLSNLLCVLGDQPLHSAAPGSLDSRWVWPVGVLTGVQREGQGERENLECFFSNTSCCFHVALGRGYILLLNITASVAGPFLQATSHLSPSSCPSCLKVAIPPPCCKYCSQQLEQGKSPFINNLSSIPFEVPSVSCWNS